MGRFRAGAGAAGLTVALALAGGLALAGCTGSGGGAADSADSAGGVAAGANAPAASGPQAAGARETGAQLGAHGSPGDAAAAQVHSLALIRTARLHVRIAHGSRIGRAADRADRIALAAGGSVYADDRRAGKHASASLTLKVPPSSLDTVLNRLAGLGHEVSRASSTQDVTERVADVASRTLSARKSLARLRALYGQATKVRDVIEIEREIASREADLESLEAQQRALSDRTATATIHLSLTAAAPPPPAQPGRGGFLGGLLNGWDAFTTTAFGLATAVGAALPFLVVLLAVGGAVWWLRRRARASRAEPTAAE